MNDFITLKNFFKQFLKLTSGITSKDIYKRVLILIEPDVLQDCLNQRLYTNILPKKEIISLR